MISARDKHSLLSCSALACIAHVTARNGLRYDPSAITNVRTVFTCYARTYSLSILKAGGFVCDRNLVPTILRAVVDPWLTTQYEISSQISSADVWGRNCDQGCHMRMRTRITHCRFVRLKHAHPVNQRTEDCFNGSPCNLFCCISSGNGWNRHIRSYNQRSELLCAGRGDCTALMRTVPLGNANNYDGGMIVKLATQLIFQYTIFE